MAQLTYVAHPLEEFSVPRKFDNPMAAMCPVSLFMPQLLQVQDRHVAGDAANPRNLLRGLPRLHQAVPAAGAGREGASDEALRASRRGLSQTRGVS